MAINISLTVTNGALPATLGIPFAESENLLSVSSLRVKNPSGAVVADGAAFLVFSRWGGPVSDSTKAIKIALVSFNPAGATGAFTIDDSAATGAPAPITVTDSLNTVQVVSSQINLIVNKTSTDLLQSCQIASVEALHATNKPQLTIPFSGLPFSQITAEAASGQNQVSVASGAVFTVGQQVELSWQGTLSSDRVAGATSVQCVEPYAEIPESATGAVVRQIVIDRGQPDEETRNVYYCYSGGPTFELSSIAFNPPNSDPLVNAHNAGSIVEDATLRSFPVFAITNITGNVLTLDSNLPAKVYPNTKVAQLAGVAQPGIFKPSATVVERATAQQVIVRQDGDFRIGGGAGLLFQNLRGSIYWEIYQGSPWLRGRVYLEVATDDTATPAVAANFEAMSLGWPTAAAFSGADSALTHAEAVTRAGLLTTTATVSSAGSRRFSVPQFSDKFPKALNGDSAGVTLGIFPAQAGVSYTMHPRENPNATASFILDFYFGDNADTAAQMTDTPNLKFSNTSYVASTKAIIGAFTNSQTWTASQLGGDTELAEAANLGEKLLKAAWDKSESINSAEIGGGTDGRYAPRDIHDWRQANSTVNFGDHYGWNVFGTTRWGHSGSPTNKNHYDPELNFFIGFLRRGDALAWKYGKQHADFTATTGQIKTNELRGGNPNYRLRGLTFMEYLANEEGRPSHTWVAGRITGYMVTGDPLYKRSVDLCLYALAGFGWSTLAESGGGNIFFDNDYSISLSDYRNAGWSIYNQAFVYWYTGEVAVRDKMRQYVRAFIDGEVRNGNHGWHKPAWKGNTANTIPAGDPNTSPDFWGQKNFGIGTFNWAGYSGLGLVLAHRVDPDGVADHLNFLERIAKWAIFGDAVLSAPGDNRVLQGNRERVNGAITERQTYLVAGNNWFPGSDATPTIPGAIGIADTVIPMTNAHKIYLPAADGSDAQMYEIVSTAGNEFVLVTGRNEDNPGGGVYHSTQITVTRAQVGSAALAHPAGALLRPAFYDWNPTNYLNDLGDLQTADLIAPVLLYTGIKTNNPSIRSSAYRLFKDVMFYRGQSANYISKTIRQPVNMVPMSYHGSAMKTHNQTNLVIETFFDSVLGANLAPLVSAGSDQSIELPANANLDGTVSDDNFPGRPLTTTWNKISGPGTVTFGNASAIDTTATFSASGVYVLRLTASDGLLSAFDEVTITVNPTGSQPSPPSITSLTPASTTAGRAQFSLTVSGESFLASNSVTFDGTSVAVTTQSATQIIVTIPAGLVAAQGSKPVVVSNLNGTSAAAYFTVGPPVNQPPAANAGSDQTVVWPAGATLSGSASDDGLPAGSVLATLWSQVSGQGVATFASPANLVTAVSFSQPGAYTLRLTTTDGALVATDDLIVTVLEPAPVLRPGQIGRKRSLQFVAGDSFQLALTLSRRGRLYNLTGVSGAFELFADRDLTQAILTRPAVVEISGARVISSLTPTETEVLKGGNRYYYRVRVTDGITVVTIASGDLRRARV